MSEQTRQLAERIARDLFTSEKGKRIRALNLCEVAVATRIDKHLAEAAGASVPQEAARDRDVLASQIAAAALLVRNGDYADALAELAKAEKSATGLTGEASSAPQGEQVTKHEDQATRADRRGISERIR